MRREISYTASMVQSSRRGRGWGRGRGMRKFLPNNFKDYCKNMVLCRYKSA